MSGIITRTAGHAQLFKIGLRDPNSAGQANVYQLNYLPSLAPAQNIYCFLSFTSCFSNVVVIIGHLRLRSL